VDIKGQAFVPASLAVAPGDTVTWTNEDSVPHNVVGSGAASFESPMLSQGQSFTHRFAQAGTYTVVCGVHPDMTSTVTASASGGGSGGDSSGGGSAAPASAPATPAPAGGMAGMDMGAAGPAAAPAAAPATTVPGVTSAAAGGVPTQCGSGDSTQSALRKHLEYGHLQASPGDQAKDLLNLNDYLRAHQVWIQNMLITPLLGC
jgi:hypothetical protein